MPDGGLTKNGANALTLSGTNTYTGPTTVNAGNLAFSSTAATPAGSQITTINNGGARILPAAIQPPQAG